MSNIEFDDAPFRALVRRLRSYCGAAIDLDDTIADTEFFAADVTKEIVNPYITRHGFSPLTTKEICEKYSGMSFSKQIALMTERFGISFPDSVHAEKAEGTLEALRRDALPIKGARLFLQFLVDYELKGMVVTASGLNRVVTTINCCHFDDILDTNPPSRSGAIPVLSLADTRTWFGQPFAPLRAKPSGDGYRFAAKFMGIPPQGLFVLEDSPPGIKAALNAGCLNTGVVSQSRRCSLLEGHADEMLQHADGRGFLVAPSWENVAQRMMTVGLDSARKKGEKDLPEALPPEFVSWLSAQFSFPPTAKTMPTCGLQ